MKVKRIYKSSPIYKQTPKKEKKLASKKLVSTNKKTTIKAQEDTKHTQHIYADIPESRVHGPTVHTKGEAGSHAKPI